MHEPWITAVLKCRDSCQQKQPCIQDRCYKEASAAYPPLSGAQAPAASCLPLLRGISRPLVSQHCARLSPQAAALT